MSIAFEGLQGALHRHFSWGLALAPLHALEGARGHLFPLAVSVLALGVALWFARASEPSTALLLALGFGGLAALVMGVAGPVLLRAPCLMGVALLLGFLAADLRAHWVEAPVLGARYYGPIEGRVIEIDRSGTDALRLTLDRVVLGRLLGAETPHRLRIALHGARESPPVGAVVMLTGHLLPPEGPVSPGGFDFRRMAYFEGLGAVGFTRSPVVLWEAPAWGEAWVGRLRAGLSHSIRAAISGEAGAFAAGAITGDRSGISQATVEALRDSSLAHILAISGMNMAFLCAFLFGLIRRSIALIPPLALRVNAKKLAAVISFPVAGFYLLLSGANVATERAFIMISVMLLAVLLDRQAISLCAAAIAAAIQLLWRPESLLSPGFQMSFAATLALISGFRALENWRLHHALPAWLSPLVTLVLSSLIGGLATAPFAAAHFNRFADYGLLANLLTVPAMGVMIMPMAVVAGLLAPLGLAAFPLWIMGLGARWILAVAEWIAVREGAVTGIVTPATLVLGLIAWGGLWLILWPGKARFAGCVCMVLGLWFWPMGARPDLMIAQDGRLLALRGAAGLALSQASGNGFAARHWLEDEGDLVAPEEAATRTGFEGPKGARRFRFGPWRAVALSGKGALAELPAACAAHDWVIYADLLPPEGGPEGCVIWDQGLLAGGGGMALWAHEKGALLRPVQISARRWDRPMMDLSRLAAALPQGMALAAP